MSTQRTECTSMTAEAPAQLLTDPATQIHGLVGKSGYDESPVTASTVQFQASEPIETRTTSILCENVLTRNPTAGSPTQKNIVTYTMSPNRLNPTSTVLHDAVFNTFRRSRNQVLYWVPPLLIAYLLMDWATERYVPIWCKKENRTIEADNLATQKRISELKTRPRRIWRHVGLETHETEETRIVHKPRQRIQRDSKDDIDLLWSHHSNFCCPSLEGFRVAPLVRRPMQPPPPRQTNSLVLKTPISLPLRRRASIATDCIRNCSCSSKCV